MIENENISECSGDCECCSVGDETVMILEVTTKNVEDFREGDRICEECWMWGCNIREERCLAEEGLSEEWPP